MAGYIGTTPVPQATQHRESFTATGGQTSFATAGYTPQFIDVYLNGVKLAPADYTATNGSDVVLASGATASDILEIVAYTPFEVANQTFTGTTTAANLTVTGAFTSQGIDDNANATAITIDSSENVGIGVTPAAWSSSLNTRALQVGSVTALWEIDSQYSSLSSNHYYAQDGNQKYITSNPATRYYQQNGAHVFSGAVSGTAGNNVSFSEYGRFDASGNFGINDSSPDGKLNVVSTAHNNGSIFDSTGTTQLWLRDTDASSNQKNWGFQVSGGSLNILRANDDRASGFVTPIEIKQAPANSLVIDASGNLLVGKPSSNSDVVGFEAAQDGHVYVTVNNTLPLYINRQSGDELLRFASNGSTVGSIGTYASNITIGTGATGLRFYDDDNVIMPRNPSTGASVNGTISLGEPLNRFKDLYLSGGVVFDAVAGNATSNTLDDYEEGAWTPVLKDGSVGAVINLSASYGYYTKIGRQVTIYGYSNRSDSTAYNSTLLITGLPFTSTNLGGYTSFNGGCWSDTTATDPIGIIYSDRNTTTAYIKTLNQSQAYFSSSDMENTRPIYFSFHYLTDS